MMRMPTFWRTTGRLVMATIVIAVQPPAAANPARARASDSQMAAMDGYFGCAFAVMRESRAKGLDTPGYEAALASRCSAEERLLHRRSVTLAEEQGMAPAAARTKADAAISAARRDLVRTYSGH